MTRYRLVSVECPDCGRRGEARGRCVIVERRTLGFWWYAALTSYDRGGGLYAEHYPSQTAAMKALDYARAKKAPDRIVLREFT